MYALYIIRPLSLSNAFNKPLHQETYHACFGGDTWHLLACGCALINCWGCLWELFSLKRNLGIYYKNKLK